VRCADRFLRARRQSRQRRQLERKFRLPLNPLRTPPRPISCDYLGERTQERRKGGFEFQHPPVLIVSQLETVANALRFAILALRQCTV